MARQAAKDEQNADGRVFRNQQKVHHDLFKLEPAQMLKNVSWTSEPRFESIEHCHIYHSVDSSGKAQTQCTPIGGHFHLVEHLPVKEGQQPQIKVGPAMVMGVRVVNGRQQRVPVPIEHDQHTHEAVYRYSDLIQVREYNAEYVKFRAMHDAQQPAKLPGVVG